MTALGRAGVAARGEKKWHSCLVVKMQSPRVQCCLCTCCVMSAMLGMFMLSAGVCLVLNYNFLEVDTSGLPSNLHNDEGKKVVGIILICLGVVSVIFSGVVSTLYFTTCTRHTPKSSVSPQNLTVENVDDKEKGVVDRPHSERGAQGRPAAQNRPSSRENHGQGSHHHLSHHHYKHLHGNGGTPGRNSPSLSGVPGSGSRRAGSLPHPRGAAPEPTNRSLVSLGKDGPSFSRSGMKGRSHTPSSSSRSHRRGKKGRHSQGRYKNPLAPHPEEAGADSQSLSESRRSASLKRGLGHVNHGADLDDDLEMTQGSVASGGSSGSSSVNHGAVKDVESGKDTRDTSRKHPRVNEQETQFIAVTHHSTHSPDSRPDSLNTHGGDDEDEEGEESGEEEEEGSGRMSRSTMDSQEWSEGLPEDSQAAKTRLDNQILELLS